MASRRAFVRAVVVVATLVAPTQQQQAGPTADAPAARKPQCWFLHGAGERCVDARGNEMEDCPEPTTTRDMLDGAPYWGDFGGTVPMDHCASLHYNHEDTVYQPFDAPALRRSVCKALCGGPGCVIVDKVLFTHSAANMYLAAALQFGDCFLGGSSDWFLANAPALGSKAADTGSSICADSTIPYLEQYVTSKVHYCNDKSGPHAGAAGATPMFNSMRTRYTYNGPPGGVGPTTSSAGQLRAVMTEHASGSLCGFDCNGQKCPSSILSHDPGCAADDAGLCALALVSYGKPNLPFKCFGTHSHCDATKDCGVIENDGMVGYSECALPTKVYTEDSSSRWYRHKGNHEDGTCVNGDATAMQSAAGTLDDTLESRLNASAGLVAGGAANQKPCTWYQEMAKLAHLGGAGEPSPRIERYSCKGVGEKGCKRDATGVHHNETACVQHCAACEPVSPCARGECSATPTTWSGAEDDGGAPFHCRCPAGFAGVRCDDAVKSSYWAAHRPEAIVLTGGGVTVGIALAVAASCVLVKRRDRRESVLVKRRPPAHGPHDPLLSPSIQGGYNPARNLSV